MDEEKDKLHAINDSQVRKSRRGWCRSIAGLGCESRCITTSLLPQTDAGYRPENTCGESSHNRYEETSHMENDLAAEPLEQTNSDNRKYRNRYADSNDQTNTTSIPESQRKDLPSIQNEREEAEQESDGEIQPLEKLRQLLVRCTTNNKTEKLTSKTKQPEVVDQIFEKLSALQALADEEILNRWDQGYDESRDCDIANDDDGDKDDGNNIEPAVWIPTSNLFDDTSDSKIDKKKDWKHLHQCIREAFPFLRTEVPIKPNSLENRGAKEENGNVADESEIKNDTDAIMSGCNSIKFTKPWVCALIDRTLFPLAPYLYDPNVDLLELYKFRQRGPIPPNSSKLNASRGNNRGQRDQKRRRKDDRFQRNQTQQKQQQTIDCGENETIQTKKISSHEGFTVLRLRPELPRDRRRNVHKILSGGGSQRRDFETVTISNYPLNGGLDSQIDCNNNENATTTAIMVHWCKSLQIQVIP